jgi:hypothetical protein
MIKNADFAVRSSIRRIDTKAVVEKKRQEPVPTLPFQSENPIALPRQFMRHKT